MGTVAQASCTRHLSSIIRYSFESWCTSTRPRRTGETAQWGGDVDTNVQWCSVVKGKLGESRILMGGEVDCVRGQRRSAGGAKDELTHIRPIYWPARYVYGTEDLYGHSARKRL